MVQVVRHDLQEEVGEVALNELQEEVVVLHASGEVAEGDLPHQEAVAEVAHHALEVAHHALKEVAVHPVEEGEVAVLHA